MTGRIPWRNVGRPEAALVGAQYAGWNEGNYPNQPYRITNTAAAPWLFAGHGPARRQQRRQLRDRGRRAELRVAPAHARPRRDPERARARQAGRDDDLHARPLDGVRRRRDQLRGERALARPVTLLLQSLEPSERRDERYRPRSLAVIGLVVAAGALVSCGSSRPRPTTLIPPPSVPLTTVTTPTKPPRDQRRAAVADVRRGQRAPAGGRRDGAAAAVPAALDVPRQAPARVPAGRRLRQRLRGGLRRPAVLDRPGERPDSLALHLPRLRLVVAGARRPPPLRHLHRQPRVPRDAAGRRARRPLARDRPHPLAPRDRPVGVVAARRERHGLRRRPERIRLRPRRPHADACVGASTPARRSRPRPRSPTDGSTSATTPARCSRSTHAPAGWSGAASATATSTRPPPSTPAASTSARSTAASTRSRPGAGPSSGASGPGATSTPRRPSGTASSSSARTTTPSTRSTAAPARSAGRITRGAPISGAASVVDGIVYFSSFDHRTYGLLAASGHLRAEWPDGEYSPAVAGNGRLYLVGLGRIYALVPAVRPGR